LGRATTRSLERVAASVGMLNGAPIEFELVKDVPDGGVLLALPALLLLGLLSKSREMFSMPEGFYPLESIFLLLALMALARIPSLEALRYVAPGEWGKLMGLDRIPEVRTLSKASLNAGATLWQSNGWRRNRNAPGSFTPMVMCGFIMENSPICLGVILPENGSVCAARPTTGSMPWTADLSLWSAAPSIPDY
jgi:hypothetical protein